MLMGYFVNSHVTIAFQIPPSQRASQPGIVIISRKSQDNDQINNLKNPQEKTTDINLLLYYLRSDSTVRVRAI